MYYKFSIIHKKIIYLLFKFFNNGSNTNHVLRFFKRLGLDKN